MPCFKGLAVSIHTPDGPIPEYSIQRQSRASRIACFIPVPPPRIYDSSSGKVEPSTFAVSITLLTPGQDVPYSAPKPTPDDPSPKPKSVGGAERGQTAGMIAPYQGLTNSPNETVAAYIYFDGRQKEEVATLLRRGEETWVNSRWVSVSDSEGGGLAEREFLFREVGLERWLNGLDLEGKDAASKIERRKQKIEKRRLHRRQASAENGGMDTDATKPAKDAKGIMRYGANETSPLENISDDDMSFSDSDDDPMPESAGQIKVALFRVLASGEIKRGEYSPQFDAHDDDDPSDEQVDTGGDADIDHTTSFAKPKSLDPKSISTQTVTGIDPTDRPYAIFTFMYRGQRQLQKMGILKDPKSQDTPGSAKRRSTQPDFATLGPLKPGGTVGFLNFRDGGDGEQGRRKGKKGDDDDEMDSDDDEEDDPVLGKADGDEDKDGDTNLSPDDLRRQGELAEGVRQIKLKRQHSSEDVSSDKKTDITAATGPSDTPPVSSKSSTPLQGAAAAPGSEASKMLSDPVNFVGSPLKKQRASLHSSDENSLRKRMDSGPSSNLSQAQGVSEEAGEKEPSATFNKPEEDVKHPDTLPEANNEDEEL